MAAPALGGFRLDPTAFAVNLALAPAKAFQSRNVVGNRSGSEQPTR